MMKQKCLFISIVLLILLFYQKCSFAQFDQLKFGIRGGLNLADSNYDVNELNNEIGGTFNQKLLPRFSVGVLTEYNFSNNFSVQLNVLYNQKGEKFIGTIVEDFVGIIDVEVINTYNYISVPAFFKMEFFNSDARPYLIAGPELSYLLSAHQKFNLDIMVIDFDTTLVDTTIKDDVQTYEWALNFGIGLEFPISSYRGFIEGRYGLGLTPFNREGEENNKNNIIYLNIGLIF
jgi:hypothetical protein